MVVSHRKRHHPLIKAGLAKKRFGILIDQFEDAFAASLHFVLESIHREKNLPRGARLGKGTNTQFGAVVGAILSQPRGGIPLIRSQRNRRLIKAARDGYEPQNGDRARARAKNRPRLIF